MSIFIIQKYKQEFLNIFVNIYKEIVINRTRNHNKYKRCVKIPDEPSLFPNQPDINEHVSKNQTSDSPFAPKTVKVTDIATRLKILEERYVTLRKKSQLAEQNIIEGEKDHFQEMKLLNENLLELKKTLKDVLEKVSMLSDEVENFAPRTDLITLQRYIEFWEPLDFVTRKEVNDFLRKKFGVSKKPKIQNIQNIKKEINDTTKEAHKQKNVSIEDAYPDNE